MPKRLLEDSDSDDDVPQIPKHLPQPPDSDEDVLGEVQSLSAIEPEEDRPVFRQQPRRVSSEYESLDYEICENKLYEAEMKKTRGRFTVKKDVHRWLVFILIGILTALVASTIDIVIEELSALKYAFLKESMDYHILSGNLAIPYIFWLLTSIIPVGLCSVLVTYVEPIAAGSGIPQVKCYLNGVKVHRIVRIKTLLVKAVGVVGSVVGGLAGGKEGPMIHSGAVVAAGISQGKSTTLNRDLKIYRYFRNDHEKRDFVLGGAAAGVSAAFGAPIGGVLFSLEEAASFWNQNLIWRTLVASVISSFALNFVLSAYHHRLNFQIPGLFNLGKFESLPYEYFEIPIYVAMGILGGLFGALWNSMNTHLNIFRNRFVKNNWGKVLEAILVSVSGVTIACFMVYYINDCRFLGNDPTAYPLQMFCQDNEYNAAAALWFQTPEATVKSLFHDPPGSHTILTLAVFVVNYFFLSCVTFGLMVSIGIFIPTVLVGAAWGRLFAIIFSTLFPSAQFLNPGKYALIGAAAQLGGVLRMTISLSVILIETTGVDPSFTFPLIITLITAKWFGDFFNEGIYDTQNKINHAPMLHWEHASTLQDLKACKIMSTPAVCLKIREKAKYVYELLKACDHNGFPVVDNVQNNDRSSGRLCGIILRSQLVVILKNKLFEEERRFWEKKNLYHMFIDEYPRFPSVKSLQFNDDKTQHTIDFTMFMNPSPNHVNEMDSASGAFQKFRALGLRHMVVVDNDNRVTGVLTRKDFLKH